MGFFSVDNMQRIKLAVHIIQAIFIFVSWCMLIAVFRGAIYVYGGPIWSFVLCFLSVPPIIYQTMTPRFERSRKWANPYAFASLDLLYTFFWLTAFASLAAYNSTGLCFGACDVSKACVGMGFFIFLFFGLTSAMSVYGVTYFRKNGTLPGASQIPISSSMIDPDREAFSTAPHDDEYAPVHTNDRDDNAHHEMDGGEGSSSTRPYDPTTYASGPRVVYAPPTVSDVSTSYRQYGDEPPSHSGYDDEETGRVRFPAGNYN